MIHGFIKGGAAVPEINVGAPKRNVAPITDLIDKAYHEQCAILVFPELCLTSCQAGDLFFSDTLLNDTETALREVIAHTAGKEILVFVGCPIRKNGKLYNCAAAICNGALLGLVPKAHIPADSERGENRWFADGPENTEALTFLGNPVPFGTDLIFSCSLMKEFTVACEIGEDLWAPTPPSCRHTAAGAAIIVNPSAMGEIVGREQYRRLMTESASGRFICAYITAEAGCGESTTDLVYGGHSILAENGKLLAENPPFGGKSLTTAVFDLQHLYHDRMKKQHGGKAHTEIPFRLTPKETDLTGVIEKSPFLPEDDKANPEKKRAICRRMLDIQAKGLAKRLRAAHASGCVIALSGGLDSTLALIVTVRAADLIGMPRSAITSVTMPCFGTTGRTRSNAEELALAFGTSFRCIDIKEAVDIHFRDIGHDPEALTVVYENAQARERTQIIMDIANGTNGLVIGTGDLSELALGWATYNGDHMSNYGVNGGVPKTIVRHLVSYYADLCEEEGNHRLSQVFRDVLATPVSPELLPAKDGEISQKTEDIVGPYELHDFFLYHFVRYGETPDKILREAKAAFVGQFEDAVIEKWLKTFMRRFFTQQFKRSALPDGPKVGSVSFSPRGDWKMPSDAVAWEV